MDKLLTPAQVAARLQVEPSTVKRWLRQGKLQGVKPGKEWRVHAEVLSAFVFNEYAEKMDHSLQDFYKFIDKLKAETLDSRDKNFKLKKEAEILIRDHAIKYALNAIQEHEAGSSIDWQDVVNVLERATEDSESRETSKVSFKNTDVAKALKRKAREADNAG